MLRHLFAADPEVGGGDVCLGDDSPDHTIAECPEWFDERCSLMGVIGPDLSLGNIIREISSNRGSWLAFSKFAEDVMRQKEDAERARENMNFDPG